MTKSEKQLWEQERARGYGRFLLRRGLLACGIPFGVLMAVWGVVFPILNHRPIDPFWEFAVKFAFHTLAFGFFMGAFFWRWREKEFQKPTDDDLA